MDLQLKGNKALVTGGTKGIGRAIADTLADEGSDVAVCARTQADVDACVAALKDKGVNAFGRGFDVGDREALQQFITDAAEALGGLDTFVSNVSGGNAPGEDGWKANFEYDVMGAVRGVEAAMPALEASSNPSIVMISSTAALEKFIGPSAYNAMKAAVIQYAGALAQEVGSKGVRVNSICPGPIMIEGGAWDRIKEHMTPFYEATVAEIPVGRMGSAQEVAAQVALLASPLGAFTSGANFVIDGAFTKRIQF